MARPKTKRLILDAMLLALALIFSYVESLIPVFAAVPGVKIGLPNLVIVFALYRMGTLDAAAIQLLRIVTVALLFGTAVSFLFALSGAVLSFLMMLLLRRCGVFGTPGVSVAGGVFHNLGQILAALFLIGFREILWYLPALLLGGTAAGAVIGLLSSAALRMLPRKLTE